MVDNVGYTPGTGATIAADDVGGVLYQRVKPAFGVDNSAVDVSASNPLPVTGSMSITGSVAVTGTFWQATQPVSGTVTANAGTGTFAVSAASLPLPTGAATETTLSGLSAKFGALGQTTMAGSAPVVIASNQSAIPVTGTFWQATQPISAASLPLPTGAATETTLAALSAKVPAAGQTTMSASQPVAIASDQSTIPVATADVTASGNITTQNLVPAGAATAGSAVAITPAGRGGLIVQVTGTYTGALSLQGTVDGSTWVTVGGLPFKNINTGATSATIVSATQGIFQAEATGFAQARVTGLAAMTGTAVVTIRATAATALVGLDAALPAGTNSIGAVTIGSGTVTTVTTLTTLANGQTAHSSASTGSPVRVAGRVNTAVDTTLVAGDASDLFVTTSGALVQKPYAMPETDWQATSGLTPLATTTSTAVRAAGAAGVRNYVTAIQLFNNSATVSTNVAILDGATVLWAGWLPATTASLPVVPVNITFPTPLRGTAATAVNIQLGTTSASVFWNAQGYQAP